MRITSLVAVFATGFTLAVTGCGGPVEPEQPTASEPAISQEQPSERIVTRQNHCPIMWQCEITNYYYDTSAQCAAECGGGECFLAPACTGDCFCP